MINMKTKKQILIGLALVLFIGGVVMQCKESSKEQPIPQMKETQHYGVYITQIDSCEYIYILKSSGTSLTHKGNCKNRVHNK